MADFSPIMTTDTPTDGRAAPDEVRTKGTQMQRRHRISRRRLRDDRGAAIVEFAFVLPILMVLICGIIDFGTTYNDYQSLRSGVRDGTRDSVVTNYGVTSSCNSGTASPSPAATNVVSKIICHVKDRAGLGYGVRVGVWAPGGWTIGASLRVCAQAFASSTTGITGPFLDGKVMTAKVEMRIEQALSTTGSPAPTFAAAQETALSGGVWPSTCSTGT
jgi:Flp pilus assembly protein TadG